MNKKTNVKIGLYIIILIVLISIAVTFLVTKNYYETTEIETEQKYEIQCENGSFSLIDNEMLVCVQQEYLSDFYCEVEI